MPQWLERRGERLLQLGSWVGLLAFRRVALRIQMMLWLKMKHAQKAGDRCGDRISITRDATMSARRAM